jgi:hypothetical protein
MALIFSTPIQTRDGFTVENAYGRVAADDQYVGTHVRGHVEIFVNKEAYTNGLRPLKTEFIQDCQVPYDRAVDGTDILNIAHEGLIAELAKQNIIATKELG